MCRYVIQTRPCGHERRVTEYCFAGDEARGIMCNSELQYILKKKFDFCRVVGCKNLGVRISSQECEKVLEDAAPEGEGTFTRVDEGGGITRLQLLRIDSICSFCNASPMNKPADEDEPLHRSIRELVLDSELEDVQPSKGPLAAPFAAPQYLLIQHITHQNSRSVETPQYLQEPYVTQTPTLDDGIENTPSVLRTDQPRSSYLCQEFAPPTFTFKAVMQSPVPQEEIDAREWEQRQAPPPRQRNPNSLWGRPQPVSKFKQARPLWQQVLPPLHRVQSPAQGQGQPPAPGQEQHPAPKQEQAPSSREERPLLNREQPSTLSQGQPPVLSREPPSGPKLGQPPSGPGHGLLERQPPSAPRPRQSYAPRQGTPSRPRRSQTSPLWQAQTTPTYEEQWPLPGQTQPQTLSQPQGQRPPHTNPQGPHRGKRAWKFRPHLRGGSHVATQSMMRHPQSFLFSTPFPGALQPRPHAHVHDPFGGLHNCMQHYASHAQRRCGLSYGPVGCVGWEAKCG